MNDIRTFYLGRQESARLTRYCERHLISASRIVRRLLSLIPWDYDDVACVVLTIPKGILKDPAELRQWLAEANQQIINQYQPTLDPADKSAGNPNPD